MTEGYMWIPLTSWIVAVAIGVIVLYIYFYVLHVENRAGKEFIITMTEKEKEAHDMALASQSVHIYLQAKAAAIQEHRQNVTRRQKELLLMMY